jgi:cell wall-associated NlpC family hydrolase
MKSRAAIIGLIFVLESAVSGSALAIQRTHRPWLMIGGHPHEVPVAAETPVEKTVVAKPVATNPVERVEAPPVRAGDKIAQQALSYKGTRYRFGGANKRGLDCSGLVARVYEDLKMKKIPRASASLYNAGTPVTLSDLRPGDLVFFKNTYRRGISHVGVYAGHNKFVHASNRKLGVTVTALSDPYYQLHYAGARRLY